MKEYLVLLNNQEPLSIRASMVIFRQHAEKIVVTFKNDLGAPVAEFSREHFVGYCEKASLNTHTKSTSNHSYTNGNGNHVKKHETENIAVNNLAHILHELQMEPDFN